MQRILNHRKRRRRGLELVHFHLLALKLLIVLEEPAHHQQSVLRQLRGFLVSVEFGVLRRDGDEDRKSVV